MKKVFLLSIFLIVIVSCAPTNFIQSSDVPWSSVEVRADMPFEKAWNEVLDVIAKKFEMELINKDGGYAKTNWSYTTNPKGNYTKNYRTRLTIKFSVDRTKVDIKTEAQYGREGHWQNGYDSALLSSAKEDVMGVIGRTTR